jgi:hypothetical protein
MAAIEVAGVVVDDAPVVDARSARSISVGRRTYPLVLPNPRDTRLHVAAVVVSIHVLGQVALGFRVSVPQILTAIGTCFNLAASPHPLRHFRGLNVRRLHGGAEY